MAQRISWARHACVASWPSTSEKFLVAAAIRCHPCQDAPAVEALQHVPACAALSQPVTVLRLAVVAAVHVFRMLAVVSALCFWVLDMPRPRADGSRLSTISHHVA
jgi:hypothetical protein